MDEYTAALLKEAFDLNDLACEQYERLEKRTGQAAQTPTPRLIHKTYEGPQPVQPQSADLDPVTQARWDAWLDARVRRATDMLADIMGEETGRLEQRLRAELATLQAEVSILKGRLEGNVTPITSPTKGKSSDAA
jgi:hypothetical protein